jgi:type IV pilus assembly protein PilY1
MKVSKSKWQVFLFCTAFGATNAYAVIDISQAPLETGTAVDPNIFFMLDDSGSMMLGFVGESLESKISVPNCTKYSYVGSNVCFLKTDTRAFLASPKKNELYFDPTVNYTVPPKADGGEYITPVFSAARIDGFNESSATVNLSNDFRAVMSEGPVGTGFTNFAISPNAQSSRAFYYQYKEGCTSNEFSDSCYTLKEVTSGQEQNFAIWFSYYRTRLLAAKTSIARAFHRQGTSMRLGYGSINKMGNRAGVRQFSGASRVAFFNWLHGAPPNNGGTPLRAALTSAGNYFKTEEPWRVEPNNSSSALLECRQNYSILMTDGYYNENTTGGEHDNVAGLLITGPKGASYQYTPKAPFAFSTGDTLADIAMNFWKNDLDAGWDESKKLANTVPTTTQNPAFWQHMVTFTVGFGVKGTVNPTAAFNAISGGQAISWPSPSTDTGKIDDMLHAAVNSRGGFFTAKKPEEFVNGLAATLSNIAERVGSASNIAATSINSLQTESNLYQARYVSGEWSGDLWSFAAGNTTTPVWRASDVLPAANDRKIYYGSTPAAKEFRWSNMTATEQNAMGGATENLGSKVVDYVRGNESDEKRFPGGIFRNRNKILGDLVNSSPELVAEPMDLNYQRYNWEGASSYRAFINGPASSRTKMIYVGGNDGMLHGFDATTGVEKFAYIPKNVMTPTVGDNVNVLKKYSEPAYLHRFSVDGTPVAVDVYINSSWKTLLVGGLGRGSANHSGGGFYALDVTDPTAFNASKVLWDKSYGETVTYLGEPQVTRTNTGQWVVILGYGYNNSTYKSGILVVDLATGNIIKQLPTSAGTSSNPNGMSDLSLLDINSDGLTDWVYGGDLHGNIWKFDLSGTSTSAWTIAYNGAPLFTATDGTVNTQMITGGVLSVMEPKTGKVWVFFGTGRYLNQSDPSSNTKQTWYGLQDGTPITGRNQLEVRYINNVGDKRTITAPSPIAADKKGWYMDLPTARERIVDMPMLVGGELLMNTVIPDTNVCNPSGSGYIMAVSPFTGARLKKPFFDLNNDRLFNQSDLVTTTEGAVVASGVSTTTLNSVPTLAKDGTDIKMFNNCEGACIEGTTINPTMNNGMQSWREITN